MPNDQRQQHSPQIETSSSPPTTTLPNNSHSLQTSKFNGAPANEETTQNNKFTLMHPAFQSVQQKRKYASDKVMNFDRNCQNRNDQNVFLNNMMHSQVIDRKVEKSNPHLLSNEKFLDHASKFKSYHDGADDMSGDSSDSEEIDLTSNGCIDFSSNNNNNNNSEKNNIEKC